MSRRWRRRRRSGTDAAAEQRARASVPLNCRQASSGTALLAGLAELAEQRNDHPNGPIRFPGAVGLHIHIGEAEQHFRMGWSVHRGRRGLASIAERHGDLDAAPQHLDAACTTFAKCGVKRYLGEVLAMKQLLGAYPPRPT